MNMAECPNDCSYTFLQYYLNKKITLNDVDGYTIFMFLEMNALPQKFSSFAIDSKSICL